MIVVVILFTLGALAWTVLWVLAQFSSPTGAVVLAPAWTVGVSWLIVVCIWVTWYFGW